jgi:hypothetical protein
MLGIEGALEVLLARWTAVPTDRSARQEVRGLLGPFRAFARFNFAARPRLALYEGRAHELEGGPGRARRSYERARDLGARFDMPYEIGLAELAIAGLEPAGSPERAAAVRAALERLEPIEARYDAARARALLGRDPFSMPDDELSREPAGAAAE